jgi:hypothetical protein
MSIEQKCYYMRVNGEKIFIPGCIGGAVYGPEGCTCYPHGEDEIKMVCSSLTDDIDYCYERVKRFENAIIKLQTELQDLVKEKDELIKLTSKLRKKRINEQEKK